MIFLNTNSINIEIKHLYLYMFDLYFLNLFELFLKLKKNKKNLIYFKFVLNKLINKYNINILFLFDFQNLNFFYKLTQSINLPVVGFQKLNSNNQIFDYSIFVSHINIYTKYIFLNEISSLYFFAKKNKQFFFLKKFLFYFFKKLI